MRNEKEIDSLRFSFPFVFRITREKRRVNFRIHSFFVAFSDPREGIFFFAEKFESANHEITEPQTVDILVRCVKFADASEAISWPAGQYERMFDLRNATHLWSPCKLLKALTAAQFRVLCRRATSTALSPCLSPPVRFNCRR